jgi:hypothetical protein
MSSIIIPELGGDPTQWWKLATIVSCGTLAGAVIPELVKVFSSTESRHVREVVTSADEGGASLGILSGFVAGNFSAYYLGWRWWLSHVDRLLVSTMGCWERIRVGDARGAGVRLRTGGVWVPRHGPGDHRSGLLRAGDRQRAVGLRVVVDRASPNIEGRSSRRDFNIRRQLRPRQVSCSKPTTARGIRSKLRRSLC